MNEKELIHMLENLQGTIQETTPDEDDLREQFGSTGELGTRGGRIGIWLQKLREAGAEGLEELNEELLEAEVALEGRYPKLAAALRSAINILDNAGI